MCLGGGVKILTTSNFDELSMNEIAHYIHEYIQENKTDAPFMVNYFMVSYSREVDMKKHSKRGKS